MNPTRLSRRYYYPGTLAVLLCAGMSSAADAPPVEPTTQFINQYLAGQWQKYKLTPAERTSDAEFLRRVSLDLIGRIPTPEEVDAFAKDAAANKRVKLIDRLLASDEHDSYWSALWTTWLLPRTWPTLVRNPVGFGCLDARLVPGTMPYSWLYRRQLQEWMQDSAVFRQGNHAEFVRRLLMASGKSNEDGSVHFLLANLGEPTQAGRASQDGMFDMVPVTQRAVRLFLGYRIDRARIEDDPTGAGWKQKHFWGINAFFRQVEREGQPPTRTGLEVQNAVLVLKDNPSLNTKGIVFYAKPNGVFLPAEPTHLNGRRIAANDKRPRREVLADYIVQDKQFAPAHVNRIWGHLFGRGLNQLREADDFGSHNEVVHPELLDRLAKDFVAGGFDTRKLLRWICASDAYQLRSTINLTNFRPEAEVCFSRMPLKLLSPEQFVESLLTTAQLKAAERNRLRRQCLEHFARRFEGDEWEDVPPRDKLAYLLAILNHAEVAVPFLTVRSQTMVNASAERDAGKVPDILYLAALGRGPTVAERTRIDQEIKNEQKAGGKDLSRLWQDLFWALLNSSEFGFNH